MDVDFDNVPRNGPVMGKEGELCMSITSLHLVCTIITHNFSRSAILSLFVSTEKQKKNNKKHWNTNLNICIRKV